MTRRGFIALSAALVVAASLSVSPWSPLPWSWVASLPGRRRWLADRLARALAELAPGAVAPEVDAGGAEEAAAALMAGLTRREVTRLLDDGSELRSHLDDLRAGDFDAGRMRFVHGWLLAESEIHVAVLLGRGARS